MLDTHWDLLCRSNIEIHSLFYIEAIFRRHSDALEPLVKQHDSRASVNNERKNVKDMVFSFLILEHKFCSSSTSSLPFAPKFSRHK
jgi:hypothetical protein